MKPKELRGGTRKFLSMGPGTLCCAIGSVNGLSMFTGIGSTL